MPLNQLHKDRELQSSYGDKERKNEICTSRVTTFTDFDGF